MSTYPRRVCVSICETDVSSLTSAIKSAAEVADIVEIRLDCFTEQDLPSAIAELRTNPSRSTILTLRPQEQGGLRAMDLEYRVQWWREHGFKLPATFFDLEIDLVERLLTDNDPVRRLVTGYLFHSRFQHRCGSEEFI